MENERAKGMTATESAHALDSATITILTWKPGPVRAVAVAVVRQSIQGNDPRFWPDSVDTSFVADADANCVGIAFKLLIKAKLIEKTGEFRRSTVEASKGRTIFQYRLLHYGMADTFLKANGAEPVAEPQQDMFQ